MYVSMSVNVWISAHMSLINFLAISFNSVHTCLHKVVDVRFDFSTTHRMLRHSAILEQCKRAFDLTYKIIILYLLLNVPMKHASYVHCTMHMLCKLHVCLLPIQHKSTAEASTKLQFDHTASLFVSFESPWFYELSMR